MVAWAEIAFLLLVVALGLRRYLHTPLHHARRRSRVWRPQSGSYVEFGMYTPSRPVPPPSSLHDRARGRHQD